MFWEAMKEQHIPDFFINVLKYIYINSKSGKKQET